MTLTEFSIALRKAIPYIILGALGVLILYYAVQLTILFIETRKEPPVKIDTVFGAIPKPIIKDATPPAGFQFELDTIEGRPVTATKSAKVYFLPQTTTRFGYREKIFLIAQTLGFNTATASYQLNGKTATFSEDTQKLTIDITNFNFTYEYFFEKNPDILKQAVIPASAASQDTAIGFFQSIGRYPEDLVKGEVVSSFFFYDPERKILSPTTRNIEANLVEVDFYRSKIEDYPIVTPKFPNSQNFVLMMATEQGYRILRAQINFFEKSEQQVGYYPIKTGEDAYEALKQGRALMVSGPSKPKKIVIKKMQMGYFDPDSYQGYLQPVYVFVGEDNFTAYVPAITDEFLTE